MNDQQVSFIGQVLADRYLVERKLGQGSVGTAYRAEDRQEGRPVTVKIFNPGIEPGDAATEALLSDARAASRLVSPSLIPTLDVGVHAGRFAFVVEPMLAGKSLERRLEETGPLPPPSAVRVGMELLAALEVMHRAGLLHLDIKPSNVFLIADPLGMERAVLGGAGTRHVLAFDQAPAKATGTCLARPEYVTPEIVSGKESDETGDIYLIGVLLYEMLTGRPPFPGTNFKATARRHALEKPVSPKLVRPQARISDDLDALVMQCLEKAQKRRFANAAALGRALETLAQAGFPLTGEASRFRATGGPTAVEAERALPGEFDGDRQAATRAQEDLRRAEAARREEAVRAEEERKSAEAKRNAEIAQAAEEAARAEAARVEAGRVEAARAEAAKAEAARAEAAKAEAAKAEAAKAEAAKAEAAKAEAAKAEAAKAEAAKAEAAKAEAAKAEAAKTEAAKTEAAKTEAAKTEAAKTEAAKAEAAKTEAAKAEAAKAEAAKAEAAKAEAAKAEAAKAEAAKAEAAKAEAAKRAETNRRAEEAKAEATRRAREAKGKTGKHAAVKKGAKKPATQPEPSQTTGEQDVLTSAGDTMVDLPAFGSRAEAAKTQVDVEALPRTQTTGESPKLDKPAEKRRSEAPRAAAAASAAPAGGTVGDDWFVETTEQLEDKQAKLSVYHFQEEKERSFFPYVMAGVAVLVGVVFLVWGRSAEVKPKAKPVPDAAVLAIEINGDAGSAPPPRPDAGPAPKAADAGPPSAAVVTDAGAAAPKAARMAALETRARDALAAKRYTGEDGVAGALIALRTLDASNAAARQIAERARDALLVESREQVKMGGFTEAREAARTALAMLPADAAAEAQLAAIDQEEQRQLAAGQAQSEAERKKAEAAQKAEAARLAEEAARTQAEEAKRKADADAAAQADEAKRKADADAAAQADEAKRKADADAAAKADEAKRKADAQAEAAQRKAEADAAKAAAAEQKKADEAAARNASEDKKKADAEAKRVAAEAKKKAADEKKKADAEARRIAAEERKKTAAEDAARRAEEAKKAAADREKNAGRVKELLAEANGHAAAGRWGDARKGYLEVTRLDGGNAAALAGLCEAAFQQEQFAEAARYGERATQAAPRNADYRVRLGMAYFKQSQYPAAKTAWEKALELSPGHPTATKYLDIVKKRLGE